MEEEKDHKKSAAMKSQKTKNKRQFWNTEIDNKIRNEEWDQEVYTACLELCSHVRREYKIKSDQFEDQELVAFMWMQSRSLNKTYPSFFNFFFKITKHEMFRLHTKGKAMSARECLIDSRNKEGGFDDPDCLLESAIETWRENDPHVPYVETNPDNPYLREGNLSITQRKVLARFIAVWQQQDLTAVNSETKKMLVERLKTICEEEGLSKDDPVLVKGRQFLKKNNRITG